MCLEDEVPEIDTGTPWWPSRGLESKTTKVCEKDGNHNYKPLGNPIWEEESVLSCFSARPLFLEFCQEGETEVNIQHISNTLGYY